MRIARPYSAVAAVLLLAASAVQARNVPLPDAKPETVGFSSERLQRLDAGMRAIVDSKQLAGIATVVARHGKIVQQMTYGQADIAGGKPMQKDTLFRIYSMTKPITGVAMMMLYEEGKWRSDEPISRYIPQFKDLKVFKGTGEGGNAILEAPAHAPTMGELMSHTAGFTYGYFGNTPVDKLYREANLLESGSLQEFIDRLAKLPLAYQPGEAWMYSMGADVQGYLVEKLSGRPFAEFLRERIFEPLGMIDTAFFVPQNKLSRLATTYSWNDQSGSLAPLAHDPAVSRSPGMPSGGGGLYSTTADYLRFAQMLLNRGELDGVRLVAPSTVELMSSNHVPEQVRSGRFGIGHYRIQPGFGFGFDVAIYEDPIRLGSTAGKGTYLWDGLAGTWFWIDPTNDVLFIGMIQRRGGVPGAPNIEDLSRQLTLQALTDPEM